MWQRAVADLDPPGVPNSFRRAHDQQNIARVLMQREAGGARRPTRLYGETQRENFWAEGESAAKVRCCAVDSDAVKHEGLISLCMRLLQHQSRYFDLPPTTKSTISIAISPDGYALISHVSPLSMLMDANRFGS